MFSTIPSELTLTTQTFSVNHVLQHLAEECYLPLRTEKTLAERELRRKATPTRGSLDKAPVSLVILIANAWTETLAMTGRNQQAARTMFVAGTQSRRLVYASHASLESRGAFRGWEKATRMTLSLKSCQREQLSPEGTSLGLSGPVTPPDSDATMTR